MAKARMNHRAVITVQKRYGLSRTDATAVHLNHTMIVATSAQVRHLIAHAGRSALISPTLLDIGAGRGEVTNAIATGLGIPASGVVAMEASAPLRMRLKARGYRAFERFDEFDGERFGAVALLNVLDRCDDPHALLSTAVRRLVPGGVLLIATVLPFCDKVYRGAHGKVGAYRKPESPLKLPYSFRCHQAPVRSFEEHAAAFTTTAFTATLPLRLLRWTRLPYLCSGDSVQTFYYLDNALFLLRRPAAEDGEPRSRRLNLLSAVFPPRMEAGRARDMEARHSLCLTEPKAAFQWLASQLRSVRPSGWGDVLDSGTGRGSLCWLLSQPTRSITAITAIETGSAYGYGPLRALAASAPASSPVHLRLGNWRNTSLLPAGSAYDVVLLDYLLAAVEMHWAHHADEVLWRVLRTVRRGGGLAVFTGIEPYELTLGAERSAAERLILDVEALGDAAAQLAHRSTFRELPMRWIIRQVERAGGFRVVATKTFPMSFGAESLQSQLSFARAEAAHVSDPDVRRALLAAVQRLHARTAALGSSRVRSRAHNYAIVLERL